MKFTSRKKYKARDSAALAFRNGTAACVLLQLGLYDEARDSDLMRV